MVRTGSARLGIGAGSGATLAEVLGSRSSSRTPRGSHPLSSSVQAHAGPRARTSGATSSGGGSVAPAVTRQARLDSALAAAADPRSLSSAVASLVEDEFAATTRAARSSMLKTWYRLHDAAFSHDLPGTPAFPLSALSIRRVGALFKAGKYQSFDNYASRAKAAHILLGDSSGGRWTAELDRVLTDTRRSVNRGVGSSRQSQPIDPCAVASLELPDSPLVPRGPLAPCDFAIVGIFFLLREIELSSAMLSHVSFSPCASLANASSGSASLLLPTSKTDIKALGATRTWDCVCRVPNLGPVCPVHALLRQQARVQNLAIELGCDAADLPLFPDAAGRHVPKAASVATILELPRRYGCPVRDSLGACLFGGHSFRTGGAAFLAGRGINPYKIQALGRWRSPLVIHYAGAAMATGLAADLGSVEPGPVRLGPSPPTGETHSVEDFLVSAPPRVTPVTSSGVFVFNVANECLHWAAGTAPDCSTRCGWGLKPGRVRFVNSVPIDVPFERICGTCLPELRETVLQKELQDMSSEED